MLDSNGQPMRSGMEEENKLGQDTIKPDLETIGGGRGGLVDVVLLTPSIAQGAKYVLGAPDVEENVLLDRRSVHRSGKAKEEDRMIQDTTRTILEERVEGQGAHALDTRSDPAPSTSSSSQSSQPTIQHNTGRQRLFPNNNDITLETSEVPG